VVKDLIQVEEEVDVKMKGKSTSGKKPANAGKKVRNGN